MFEQWIDLDLQKLPRLNGLKGYLFSQDSGANKIGVNVKRGSATVTLVGTVKAWIITPDGQTLEVTGAKSGNQAWVVLPEEAYEHPGRIRLSLKLINGSEIATLCAIEAYVYKAQE